MTNALVIGGGLSGLAATWRLRRHGVEAVLLEARARLGGRVLTLAHGGGAFDLGPSWIWPGQPHLAKLLEHFRIATYEQVCDGELLLQRADGAIGRDPLLKPMQHALRIDGGVAALVAAIAAELPPAAVRLRTAVTTLELGDRDVLVGADGPDGPVALRAARVALALPPRLAAGLRFAPALDAASLGLLRATPTWMAGHAKFVALYEAPFWRAQGLSGDALSQRGPLAEIHDASPRTGGPYALFGFVGLDATARAAMTEPRLCRAAVAQLVELFGPAAGAPLHAQLMDWSDEPFTAAPADRQAPDHHPEYGLRLTPTGRWREAVRFISTETSFEDGGLLEGALRQGLAFAAEVVGSQQAEGDAGAGGAPHRASMSWAWLR